MTDTTSLTNRESPHRVQRKRTKGWKMPSNTVFVGRPSRWGNPFKVGEHVFGNDDVTMTAKDCVMAYADMLNPYRHKAPNNGLDKFYISIANMEDIQHNLRGKNLACWCKLEEPCHADVLLEIANDYPCEYSGVEVNENNSKMNYLNGQSDKHMSIGMDEADKYLAQHRKCYPNAVYVSPRKQIIANMSMPVCNPLDHPHHWAWMGDEGFTRLRAGLSAQDPDQMLCSMVRAKESLESCNGKCDHIDGKTYTINDKKYTCVKVLRTSNKWMERVNKIMSQ